MSANAHAALSASSFAVLSRDEVLALMGAALRAHLEAGASEPEILTLEQAAALLQMDPVSVRKYVRKLDLPAHKLGDREWRFKRSEIMAWLSAQARP